MIRLKIGFLFPGLGMALIARQAAASFLEPLGKQINSAGLGTLSEIFDGDPPFTPRGCIAQAWTMGEVLRVWRATVS